MPADHSRNLTAALRNFDIAATVTDVIRGATVDRYVLKPGSGVRVAQIARLSDDLAVHLDVERVRVLPTGGGVAVEVPADERRIVTLTEATGDIDADHPLTVPVGVSVDGSGVSTRLDELPHLLVAGTTGSGKSTAVTAMLAHLVTEASPQEVQLALIDPKRVELAQFADLPHLARPIATDVETAVRLLEDVLAEVEQRYAKLEAAGERHIADLDNPPYYVVVVVDELADLMMSAGKRAEHAIVRLLQIGRAAGVHLILATQRPSADVVTGLIKANTPSRLIFAVQSHVDSGVALGQSGAEKLLGQGDGLWWPAGARQPERVQSPYVSTKELAAKLAPLRSEAPASPEPTATPDEVAEELEAETARERDDLVRESMLAGLRASVSTRATVSTPEEAASFPVPSVEGEPVDDVELGAGSPAALMRATEAEWNEAFHMGYEKGRKHAEYELDLPTHRPTWSRDWKIAIPLALLATVASILALPALPLAVGAWVGWLIIRRRTSMVTYRESLAPRRTGERP